MNHKKIKWFFYTVAIGLIPLCSRLLIFATVSDKDYNFLFNEVDFITLGLISQVSNINELEDSDYFDRTWKTIYTGLAVTFIILFAVLFTISLLESTLSEPLKIKNLKWISGILGAVSILISYSIYDRMKIFKSDQ